MVDSLIISIDTTNGKDNTVLIVGRKTVGQQVEIVNAFQGEEALKLYSQLTVKECLGYFLIYVAIAGGAIFLLGYDLSWKERLGIFLGLTVFVGLIVTGAYLISGVGV